MIPTAAGVFPLRPLWDVLFLCVPSKLLPPRGPPLLRFLLRGVPVASRSGTYRSPLFCIGIVAPYRFVAMAGILTAYCSSPLSSPVLAWSAPRRVFAPGGSGN